MIPQRLNRLLTVLQNTSLEALALAPGPSLAYLTGLRFHLLERPIVALFTKEGRAAIVLPELEALALSGAALEVFPYPEEPSAWGQAFRRAVQALYLEGRRIGVEPRWMRLLEFRYLEQAMADGSRAATFLDAAEVVSGLRLCKDEQEIAALQRAVSLAQAALEATLPMIKPGLSERAIAALLLTNLLQQGSQPDLPFAPIVAAGPNAANPHAAPTDRPLQVGDLLIIDWGATVNGYVSDLTRTFAIGAVDEEAQRIYEVVRAANEAAREILKPGLPCALVDEAARRVIEQAGYGRYFVHRTGHGIGLEAHEAPYLRAGNDQPLQSGMTFTIEPGIYLPGRHGVRIEDNVVITDQGADCLSDWPRTLQVLG